ncbi:thioredoxin family protein [Scytonema millei]|uniref:Thioredoxin n=1 Tax=Scytonema millei VB511283 TaxID=1245923 RepID=A0A9X5E926_9CYAN|nr:thioredoxin family protein [Scytonema millei]NHC37585.1 thioredoxin family protein [Scytonema millei VB511283]
MVLSVNERTFTKEVLESSVPVLVNFWAPWCGLCHLIQPVLSEFHKHGGQHVKIVGVNADENFRLSNTYRLTTLPTLILIEKGIVRQRLDRLHSRDELRQVLKSIQYDYANSVRLEIGARS